MRALLLLCCWALLALVCRGASVPDHEPYDDDHHDDDDDEHDEEVAHLRERLHHLDDELNHLIAKLQHLHDEYEHKVHDREAAQTKASNLKLRMAKGDHVCKKGFFRCASAEDQCVSDMLVCDGEEDCHDGSDEDEHVCSDPMPVGAVFEGRPLYDHCTHRQPDHVQIEVIHDDHEDAWASRKHVEARLYMEAEHDHVHHHDSLPLNGYYYFSKHLAIFDPPEEDMLGIIAEFDPGHDDTMMAYVQHEDEHEPCAEFDLHLVHH